MYTRRAYSTLQGTANFLACVRYTSPPTKRYAHLSQPVSALDLALAHGLVGCVKDAPVDLSKNKDYLHGYGE
ncbi:MAG: hypothetical protein BECKG1743F_GA0114225_100232 [Candidatus Kentron sp. G]|nr:MAG: hypothetical protein BECKG1743F_GA0114225_100232 [Candidatus Kentron sp. G]